ncbi:MAG: hypothetical protein NVV74_03100 [Magnetospirillum sp.]|nr:hypothetical protein [Magnetospirillum sp.]
MKGLGARTTSIGFRLLLLALAASLPVILFAAFIVMQMAEDRRQRELEELVQRASAVSAAVEQVLYGASRELAALAVDEDLRFGNLTAAYEEARAFIGQSAIGGSISLLSPDGAILFNTRRKLGAALPCRATFRVCSRWWAAAACGCPTCSSAPSRGGPSSPWMSRS